MLVGSIYIKPPPLPLSQSELLKTKISLTDTLNI